MVQRGRAEQYLDRGEAFYRLGNYGAALEDFRKCISLGSNYSDLESDAYLLAVGSEVQLGKPADALMTAREWLVKTRTPKAARVVEILENNLTNPQRALTLLMGQW